MLFNLITVLNVFSFCPYIFFICFILFITIQKCCPRLRLRAWAREFEYDEENGEEEQKEEEDDDYDDDDNQDFDIERQFVINRRKKQKEIEEKLKLIGFL
ncbi:hypothetical protein B9Z55_015667 [Caenorhabditis nigoni]|uniref:Uncharacterized protein n=1 Tax=Caenorhabditis nigoni TaxID=1611254 RepID=A0A2G5UB87_9PELO|nr:hypothetical protein B9Z55_015667 [Caenorhabditis nigoni]